MKIVFDFMIKLEILVDIGETGERRVFSLFLLLVGNTLLVLEVHKLFILFHFLLDTTQLLHVNLPTLHHHF